jgi:hypothetical protein
MATVVFTAIGAAVGGPIGAAIGAVVGSQVDAELFRGSDRQGPRLKDLTITSSAYGAAIPRHFGKMRVGGAVIWATDLVEHASTTSTGKGKPALTSYSYSSSFAVALASRPILGVGRIWADGQLLRGASGDLKVGGSLRVYLGGDDQQPDPLIASAEGIDTCPAYRGTAYVVFEDLQLASYGNRIPSLNFEIFCDEGDLSLSQAIVDVVDGVDADVPLAGVLGFSCEGPLTSVLAQFNAVYPMTSDANGTELTISRFRLQDAPIALGEAAVASDQADFGGQVGFARKLAPPPQSLPGIIRYYDYDADYQPCSQRAPGKSTLGRPQAIELPATLQSGTAFQLIAKSARSSGWSRDTLAWRGADLDQSVGPGSIVTISQMPGHWRVNEWEWRTAGVEMMLERVAPECDATMATTAAGQAKLASDIVVTPTLLLAFEAPMADTTSSPAIYAAPSSTGPGWTGAALFVDSGDGQLEPISSTGRTRSVIGKCLTTLAAGPIAVIDRANRLTVQLAGDDMALDNASPRELAMGANRVLVGAEIIQFARAVALGGRTWELSGLLRARAGTEAAITSHIGNEDFILLNEAPVAIDYNKIPDGPLVRLAALGLKDATAVEASFACRGIATRPLAPVHARAVSLGDMVNLSWARRARGAWRWPPNVEVPMQEEAEAYLIGLGPIDSPTQTWLANENSLSISALSIAATSSSQPLWVRQIGTHSMSDATSFSF